MLDRNCLWCGAPTIGDLCPHCRDAIRDAGKELAALRAELAAAQEARERAEVDRAAALKAGERAETERGLANAARQASDDACIRATDRANAAERQLCEANMKRLRAESEGAAMRQALERILDMADHNPRCAYCPTIAHIAGNVLDTATSSAAFLRTARQVTAALQEALDWGWNGTPFPEALIDIIERGRAALAAAKAQGLMPEEERNATQ